MAVAIVVTVLTTQPPTDVFVPVVVAVAFPEGAAGVELGEEMSKHEEILEPPRVRRSLDPPWTSLPESNAPSTNCVPDAMLVFQTIIISTRRKWRKRDIPSFVASPADSIWKAYPPVLAPVMVTVATADASQ